MAETVHKPKAAYTPSVNWKDANPSMPTKHEVLFFAFLLVSGGRNAGELRKWALMMADVVGDMTHASLVPQKHLR